MGKKYRQCPNCKSSKGYKAEYLISGNGHEICDFKGRVVGAERETFDSIQYVECISCGKNLEIQKVQTSFE